jgi:class 3 adenylate cyclase
VVNQMVGDGLMAIFGAPLPLENREEQAVRAALEMMEMIELFNIDQVAQGKAPIRIGVGIASGQMIAGYTGTIRRATYTCVGDAVNQAARLEAHTKVVGQPILIDEATRQKLSSAIQVEEQGVVQLKGKTQEIKFFVVPVNQ